MFAKEHVEYQAIDLPDRMDMSDAEMLAEAKENYDPKIASKLIAKFPNSTHLQYAFVLLGEQRFKKNNFKGALDVLLQCLLKHPDIKEKGSVIFGLSQIYERLESRLMQKIALRYLKKNASGKSVSFAGKKVFVDAYVQQHLKTAAENINPYYVKMDGIPEKMWEIEDAVNIDWIKVNSTLHKTLKDKVFLFRDNHTLECRKRSDGKIIWKSKGISPGWMGVYITSVIENNLHGSQITQIVKGSPAEKQGLREDDIILTINDRKIKDTDELIETIAKLSSGKKITIGLMRNDKKIKVPFVLGGRQTTIIFSQIEGGHSHMKSFLGISWS